MEWYAIQTYSGSEQSVKRAIENLIVENRLQDKFEEVVVPTEAIYEDKKKIMQKSLYPGYVFVKMELDTDLWHTIQSLPRVGRFIGESKKPTPLGSADIEKILDKIRNPAEPRPKVFFETGEMVRVSDGAFANFTGAVEEYDLEHRKVKINISIFGRNTLVEIPYSQVEKIL